MLKNTVQRDTKLNYRIHKILCEIFQTPTIESKYAVGIFR